MIKRILALLLAAAMLLLAAGCGEKGKGKILSTEGVPQEVLQSAQYKAALAEETATVIAYNYEPMTDSAPLRAAVEKMRAGEDAELRQYSVADGIVQLRQRSVDNHFGKLWRSHEKRVRKKMDQLPIKS